MVQSFNAKALVTLASVLRRPYLMSPHVFVNNISGALDDDDYKDAIEIETSLQIPVIRHDEKKPGGLNECLAHFHLDDPCQICMIGDRLLTGTRNA